MTQSERLTDERLAWLAAKDYCQQRATSHRPAFWLFVVLSFGRVAHLRHRETEDRMNDYAFAVDDIARRLNPAERAILRSERQLPDWFLPAVEEEVVKLRKIRQKA